VTEGQEPPRGPTVPDIWLTLAPGDDRDMRLRVIATWLLLFAVGMPVILCFVLRIYLPPANQLLRGALLCAVSVYLSFRTLRAFLKVGAALFGSAMIAIVLDCLAALYAMRLLSVG
jgi:hypothetical protein